LCTNVRESLKNVNAPWSVYLVAIGVGFALPLMSYFGSHDASFPSSDASRTALARVFIVNLFLSPLWEEIIWRGCFLSRLRSFVSAPRAIAISSVAWTFWHGGYLAFLYSRGIPIGVLVVLPFTYFCVGIILGSVFEMGRRSLWPCVLLHAAFNASTAVYYTTYDRASELSSYIAELVAVFVVAGLFFRFTAKRGHGGHAPDANVSTV
jgi:membrane protease YdiL (CAAX protease family)